MSLFMDKGQTHKWIAEHEEEMGNGDKNTGQGECRKP